MKMLVMILTAVTIGIMALILGFLMGALGYWFIVPVIAILLYLNLKDYKIVKREKRNETTKKD